MFEFNQYQAVLGGGARAAAYRLVLRFAKRTARLLTPWCLPVFLLLAVTWRDPTTRYLALVAAFQTVFLSKTLALILRVEHTGVSTVGEQFYPPGAAASDMLDKARRVDHHTTRLPVQKSFQPFRHADQ